MTRINSIKWDFEAWQDYLYWQKNDRVIFKRINQIIKDIKRSPFEGIGKPEALRNNLSGLWSRRINKEHRVVYLIEEDTIVIFQCKGHYK
ncbi:MULTISPECIES: Txe/YoeB family addiction module toxin [Peptoniphilus]|jgi:addiction module toxin, txe/yoeB family|uniref:Txe/YoeB family addiction module toxin n=1 Tax=Peptoniphilus TaxID=162289 RepID=UPI0008D8EB75|nr:MULTISPECIES: Txe/YoeB family addiction module toxin [Peptoniphilus]MDU1043067.1 Txe/YoeB family addiction module toxin [Peptoniphilus rhinitidis]MDU2110013.1 Txe/YoeB family addiction module toxin [Peptoniphilus lacydonensis]MDU2114793.1 Txe/YoeB family addiction module toxin [Peptoniphilus lacydonensis]MDU3750559.1 Txe/YoeB family addiction module toxin [Peptoniphilus rhinitidis]MDU5377422.1 Txe/YoeB family addiction module toxin [Peptoniphilus lacydonensis]